MLDSNNKSVADTLANKGLAILESRRRAASLPNLPKFAVEGETPSTTTKEDEEALLGCVQWLILNRFLMHLFGYLR